MNFAFCLEMLYSDLPFIDRLAQAKKDGINSIEFWDWRNKDLRALKDEMQKLEMKVCNISGNRNFGMIDPHEKNDFLNEVKQTAVATKELDCPTLMLLVQKLEQPDNRGKLPSVALSYEEIEANIITIGKEIGKIADELNLNIVIEPLNDALDHHDYLLNSSAMGFRIIKAINHPRVKLLYDIYHMAMQDEDIFGDVENNLQQIGYFHIADKPGRNEPGTGEIDYTRMLEVLKQKNYQGTVGFELAPRYDTDRAVKAIFKLINHV
ncbi:TIM barrel protein [candidate division KSB1 bacterium]|nr:TIM barrel protein [candidate division KSB1 bacterium]